MINHGGGKKETNDLFIDYNLGERVDISIKVFNNLPLSSNDEPVGFEDYCCIYIIFFINEYYIDNEKDYIYYCTNCECTKSNGEKTFCYKYNDKRQYCEPERGKEYNFFIRINGLNELDLMDANVEIKNYYKLLGRNYYLEDDQETIPLYFSSNSVLWVDYDSRHKVNLNELLIQYSYEGDGEFYTINNKKLDSSGVIGEDIYFKKLTNLNTSLLYKIKLTAQTISKFGKHKNTSTSMNLIFIIVPMDIKCTINLFVINVLNHVLIVLNQETIHIIIVMNVTIIILIIISLITIIGKTVILLVKVIIN